MPTYAEERDRVCADGSRWLTPLMREMFSHRMSEWHEPYSDDKKLFIDCLMRWQYKRECPTNEERIKLVDMFRKQINWKKVGLIMVPEWLKTILLEAGIDIKYTIDHEDNLSLPSTFKQRVKRRFRYIYKKLKYRDILPSLSLNDVLPKVDIIIVADYINFPKWSRCIAKKKKGQVLPITQLVF